MADPFSGQFGGGGSDPFSGGSNPFGGGSRRKKSKGLTQIEASEILSSLGGTVASGLSTIGNILDTPGAMVRDTLAGQNPFSNIFNPEERTTGRGLLEQYGVLDANEEGLDWGDAAGFLAEVALDPAWLAGGLTKSLVKGSGNAAAEVAERVTKSAESMVADVGEAGAERMTLGGSPMRLMDEVRSGERALGSIKLPFIGDKPIATFGTGPAAAQIIENVYYNPVSRGFRKLFEKRVRDVSSKSDMMQADRLFDEMADKAAVQTERTAQFHTRLNAVDAAGASELRQFVSDNPEDFQQAFGEIDVAKAMARVEDGGMTDDALVRHLGENRHMVPTEAGNQHGLTPTSDMIGESVGQRIVVNSLKEKSAALGAKESVQEAAGLFDDIARDLSGLKNSVHKSLVDRGYKIGELEDAFTKHMPRRLDRELASVMARSAARLKTKGMGKSKVTGFEHAIQRKEVLTNLEGGTYTVNRLTRDPALTGSGPQMTHAQKIDHLAENYPEIRPGTGPGVPGMIEEMGDERLNGLIEYLEKLPDEVQASGGLFSRNVIDDVADYVAQGTRVRTGMDSVYRMLVATAKPADDIADSLGPSVASILGSGGLGLESKVAGKHLAAKLNIPEEDLAKMHVPSEFVDTAKKFFDWQAKPEEATGLLKGYDKFLALFKGSVYSVFPASHSRNLIGGTWQNMVTAFKDPVVAAKSIKMTVDIMRGKGSKYLQEFERAGFINESQLKEFSKHITMGEASGAPGVASFGNVKRRVGEARANFKETRKESGLLKAMLGKDNILGPFNQAGVREGLEGGSTNVANIMGEELGGAVEFFNRASHYIARREAGWTADAASRSVKMSHFDYSDLSRFEQQTMKRLIPFYTFTRKNVPMQFKELLTNPGGPTAQTIRLMDTVQDESGQPSLMPEWLREKTAISMSSDGETDRYLTLNNFLPIEEATNKLVTTGGVPDVGRMIQKVAGMTSPLIQYPIEQMTGQQLWSGRKLQDLFQSPTDTPWVNNLIAKSPWSRMETTERKWRDDRKTLLDKIGSTLVGGVGVTDIDTEKQMKYEARRVIEELLGPLPESKSYERMYIPNEDIDGLDEESKKQYQLYKFLTSQ